jgi:predicted nucleic acid-binding protein
MVLVDTSVWVEHFRHGQPELARLLGAGAVACHPFVLGELACGDLKRRREILGLLQTLRTCCVARHEEVLSFIESNRLRGRGLGYIDVHLLASARLGGVLLWTRDPSLWNAASDLNTAYSGQ